MTSKAFTVIDKAKCYIKSDHLDNYRVHPKLSDNPKIDVVQTKQPYFSSFQQEKTLDTFI